MLNTQNIISFIGTTDADRAKHFYETLLGLRLESEEPFALVFDANNIMLRVSIVEKVHPAEYTVLGWKVNDIKAAIGELTDRGIFFERFPNFQQDDLGVWTAPDGTKVAWFKDPDGNMLSITEFSGR